MTTPRIPRRAALRALSALSALPLAAALPAGADALEEVPYVKTPQAVVDGILSLARVRADDRLVDLGSGDGRIVIAAARRFGTPGLGVEIDPTLVTLSNERAAAAGVSHLARFVAQDLFETDLRDATVVTLYLLPDVNLALRPRLLEMLAPGARVVSHDWTMGDWRPDDTLIVPAPDKPVGREKFSRLMLWIVPARVAGRWQGRIDGVGAPLSLALRQRFQDLEVAGPAGPPAAGSVTGIRVRLPVRVDGREVILEGALQGSGLEGSVMLGERRAQWRLERAGD